jgi:hypothetical protein
MKNDNRTILSKVFWKNFRDFDIYYYFKHDIYYAVLYVCIYIMLKIINLKIKKTFRNTYY